MPPRLQRCTRPASAGRPRPDARASARLDPEKRFEGVARLCLDGRMALAEDARAGTSKPRCTVLDPDEPALAKPEHWCIVFLEILKDALLLCLAHVLRRWI